MLEDHDEFGGIVTLSGAPIRAAVLCLLLFSRAALAQTPDLSGSDAALAALVANLDRRDHALQTIVEAIATFRDRAKPHLDSLLGLRKELEAHVDDEDDPLALDPWRKQSIVETITSLAAEFETLDDY